MTLDVIEVPQDSTLAPIQAKPKVQWKPIDLSKETDKKRRKKETNSAGRVVERKKNKTVLHPLSTH